MSRASYERLRSMYPGGRPDERARRYARFWLAVISWGLMPRRWVTLEVKGRTSGRPISLPLGMADVGDNWYLVPMLGQSSNWVHNVRAADGRATLSRRNAYPCRLVEVPQHERAAILKRYLLGENSTLLGLTQAGGVLYYLLGTNQNINPGANPQSSLCARRTSDGTRHGHRGAGSAYVDVDARSCS